MGFPKCGTTSFLDYLKKKYDTDVAKERGFYPFDFKNKISRREWCYHPFEEQKKRFIHEFGDPADFKICFIKRDPVERIWSGWEAWNHYYQGYTFEQYLNLKTEDYNGGLSYLGEVNPIEQVDYWKWITPWMKEYGSKVVEVYLLEGLMNHPDFPQTNSLKKSSVPDEYRKMIEDKLNEVGIIHDSDNRGAKNE